MSKKSKQKRKQLKRGETYGAYKCFRDFVDAMCDKFKPTTAYIYPTFAVFDFPWTTDAKEFDEYLEDNTKIYGGVYWERENFWVVVVDSESNIK